MSPGGSSPSAPGPPERARRATDPEDFDGRGLRGDGGGIDIGYGSIRVRLFGRDGIIVLLLVVVVAGVLYQGWDRKTEHAAMARSLSITNCILTLTVEERVRLRAKIAPTTLEAYCPWIEP